MEQIIEFLSKLNAAVLVKIEVNSHADAFTLFETINNTGVKLSAIDLIKNNILSQYEKKLGGSIDEAFAKWLRIVDNIPDDNNYQERFLRQYYNAFKHGPLYRIDGVSIATKSNLISIYEQLIERDVEAIFADLIANSKIYGDLVNAENEAYDERVNCSLRELDRIGATPAYSLLLYVFRKIADRTDFKVELMNYLAAYFVRRNLTNIPPTRDLDRIFIALIEEFERIGADIEMQQVKEFFGSKTQVAGDELFKEKLSGNIYEENSSAARYILCKLEEINNQTREIYTDLWARDSKDRYIWTIEHIFPQGENVPKAWVDMIAGGDASKARDIVDSHAHKLGNLTITGYNSKLGNLSFDRKRDRVDRRGRNVGYNNGLYLNRELVAKPSWTVADIESRTHELVGQALKVFRI